MRGRHSVPALSTQIPGQARTRTTRCKSSSPSTLTKLPLTPLHALCARLGLLDTLAQVSRALRTLPYVEPTLPTLALVGAPNVGKSSLVRVLSSGVPEVCNYPFTTRSIKMGHFYVDAARHQVRR